jgi:ABC-type branched-subunit amino acid transport system ATPase component
MTTVLEAINLEKRFGGIIATDNVCLKVEKGARLALIGPNGAGKTTLVNLLTGVLRPTSGKIFLEGRDISGLEPYEQVHLGMARTFSDQSIIRRSYARRDNRTSRFVSAWEGVRIGGGSLAPRRRWLGALPS